MVRPRAASPQEIALRQDEIIARLDEIGARLSKLEQLSRGGVAVYVGGNRLLVRCDAGQLRTIYFVEADDKLIVPNLIAEGIYEPEVTRFMEANIRQSDHCLDVGAHFGYYTCIMAKLAWKGRVLAVEPDHTAYLLLRDNIYANWCESITSALNVAIAGKAGSLTLFRRNLRSGNTSIANFNPQAAEELGEPPPTPLDVVAMPIDSLLPRMGGRIDIIKIDIEGAEPLAFRGLSQTLKANPGIRIIMEWSPDQVRTAGFDVAAFTNEIATLGLIPHVISQERAVPVSWNDLLSTPYLSGVVFSMRPLAPVDVPR